MKVFDLSCVTGHRFEGWFASAEQFTEQCGALAIACPICESNEIRREPSAPRLNFGGDSPAGPTRDPGASALVDHLRLLLAQTENVGPRFAEEARRIHYEETEARPIRGTATEHERRALRDEGIETLNIPIPRMLTETMQ